MNQNEKKPDYKQEVQEERNRGKSKQGKEMMAETPVVGISNCYIITNNNNNNY